MFRKNQQINTFRLRSEIRREVLPIRFELTQKQFTSSIIRAQKQMEARNFSIRKHLFDYDSVIDKQRKRIYNKRDEILDSELEENKKETKGNFVFYLFRRQASLNKSTVSQ